jgi:hypothetical protein
MRLFFSDKSIVLFELFDRWWKEVKQIKGPHHNQGDKQAARQEINLYHICHHKQSLTMGFPPSTSNIARRPTPDPNLVTPSLVQITIQQHCHRKTAWDSFERPQNCRIPSPTSSPISAIWNRTCSHHCPHRAPCPSILGGTVLQFRWTTAAKKVRTHPLVA